MENIEVEGMETIGIEEVKERTGYGSDEIYFAIYDGDFPGQVSFGGKYFGWLESEIEEWIFVQVLMASWSKNCVWRGKDYMRIRNNTSSVLDDRLWTINDMQGDCGMVCGKRIAEMHKDQDYEMGMYADQD